jgi:prevent-host-death family protein
MRETLDIGEARKMLGSLVARAVHGRQPTVITCSGGERAVLISEGRYEELLRAREDLEVGRVREAIAVRERGESNMHRYETRDGLYADFGLPVPGERP